MSLPEKPTLKDVEDLIRKIPEQEGFEDNYYTFFHVGSQILLLSMEEKSSEEDIKAITLPDGKPAFTEESDIKKMSELLRDHGPKIKQVMEAAKMKPTADTVQTQSGGSHLGETQGQTPLRGGGDPPPAESGTSPLDTLIEIAKMAYIPPEEISFDRQFLKLTDFWDRLDELNRSISRELGLVALLSRAKTDPFVMVPMPGPLPPVKMQFPMRLAIPLINLLLEVTRIYFALTPFGTIPMQFFTIIQTLFDIARGEWKYGVFTFMGFFNGGLLVLGVFFKLIRDVWLLMEPNLSKQIRLDMWLVGRSMFVGFWLRMVTMFMPDFARNAAEAAFLPLKTMLMGVNTTLGTIEETVKKVTEPLGVTVIFPRVPPDMIPSLDSIATLQTTLAQPEIFCAPEFQQIIDPLKYIPPLRLFVELLNVPVDKQMVAIRCKGVQTNDIASALVAKLSPQVKIIPGGQAATAAEAAKMAQQIKLLSNLDSLTELFSGGLLANLKKMIGKLAKSGLSGAAKDAAIKEIKEKMKKDAIDLLKDKLSKTVGPALAAGLKDTLDKNIGPALDEPLEKIVKDNLSKSSSDDEAQKKEDSKQEEKKEEGKDEEIKQAGGFYDNTIMDRVNYSLNEMASRLMNSSAI